MHNADGVSVRNTDDAPEQSAARIVMSEATWQRFFSLMISKELIHKVQRESVHLVEAAKTLIEASMKTGVQLVNVELDLSRTLAERALASFSTGDLDNAMRTARGARHGHRTAWKFLPALNVTAEQRGLIEEKLAELEVMMAKLSVREMEANRNVRPDTEGIGRVPLSAG